MNLCNRSRKGKRCNTHLPATLSCSLAGCTSTRSSHPCVSTAICRLLPFLRLYGSSPQAPFFPPSARTGCRRSPHSVRLHALLPGGSLCARHHLSASECYARLSDARRRTPLPRAENHAVTCATGTLFASSTTGHSPFLGDCGRHSVPVFSWGARGR